MEVNNYIVILTDVCDNEFPIGFYNDLDKAKNHIIQQMDMINDKTHHSRINNNNDSDNNFLLTYLNYKIYKYNIDNNLIIPTVNGNIDTFRHMNLVFTINL
jgi:hypothetical protein